MDAEQEQQQTDWHNERGNDGYNERGAMLCINCNDSIMLGNENEIVNCDGVCHHPLCGKCFADLRQPSDMNFGA